MEVGRETSHRASVLIEEGGGGNVAFTSCLGLAKRQSRPWASREAGQGRWGIGVPEPTFPGPRMETGSSMGES